MMISKTTFVAIVSMLMKNVDDKKELLECSGDLPDKCVECIMEETEFQQDLITMLTVVTFDRFGVIRDYLYERDENGEYFFGIPKGNKIEVYLLTSAEDLYEYLAEESEGDIFREAYCLEGSHIFTAGKNVGSGHFCVDFHNGSCDKFFLI